MSSPRDKTCSCGNKIHRASKMCEPCARKLWIINLPTFIVSPKRSAIQRKTCMFCQKEFTNLRKTKQKSSYNWTISPKQFSVMRFCSRTCHGQYLAVNDLRKGKHANCWKGGIAIGQNRRTYRAFKRLEYLARKKGNGGSHTIEQWQELKRKWNYMCLCCKKTEPDIFLSQDHIMPLSMGGTDDISNIQPLCRSCNSKKNAKFINYSDLYATSTH